MHMKQFSTISVSSLRFLEILYDFWDFGGILVFLRMCLLRRPPRLSRPPGSLYCRSLAMWFALGGDASLVVGVVTVRVVTQLGIFLRYKSRWNNDKNGSNGMVGLLAPRAKDVSLALPGSTQTPGSTQHFPTTVLQTQLSHHGRVRFSY
jgi:hypothetical protein